MKPSQTIEWKPFSDKHKQYIKKALNSKMSVAEGSIRSGKTIDNCIIACAYLETCPDKIHLATGSTIANAKLNIGACNGFGLENLFRGRCHWGKYKDNECLYIQTKTGEKIVVFAGGGKADSYKKILGNSYGLWIATEINEHFDSDNSRESFVKVAMGRQVASLKPMILWDLNPSNPNCPIYERYIDAYAKKGLLGGYNYMHFTLADNLSISDERRREIESQYDPNSIWYKRDILGERCVAESLIYFVDHTKNIITNYNASDYIDSVVVMDTGDTVSATSIVLMGLRRNFDGVDVLKEYHHRNADNNEKELRQTLQDDCDTLAEFVIDSCEMLGRKPSAILFDGSESVEYEIEQSFRKHRLYGYDVRRATKKLKYAYKEAETNGWITDRIRYVSSLLFKGRLRFLDKCKFTIMAFESAQYNPKKLEQGIEERLDEPQNNTMCDELDAVDYGVIYFRDDLERKYE